MYTLPITVTDVDMLPWPMWIYTVSLRWSRNCECYSVLLLECPDRYHEWLFPFSCCWHKLVIVKLSVYIIINTLMLVYIHIHIYTHGYCIPIFIELEKYLKKKKLVLYQHLPTFLGDVDRRSYLPLIHKSYNWKNGRGQITKVEELKSSLYWRILIIYLPLPKEIILKILVRFYLRSYFLRGNITPCGLIHFLYLHLS